MKTYPEYELNSKEGKRVVIQTLATIVLAWLLVIYKLHYAVPPLQGGKYYEPFVILSYALPALFVWFLVAVFRKALRERERHKERSD